MLRISAGLYCNERRPYKNTSAALCFICCRRRMRILSPKSSTEEYLESWIRIHTGHSVYFLRTRGPSPIFSSATQPPGRQERGAFIKEPGRPATRKNSMGSVVLRSDLFLLFNAGVRCSAPKGPYPSELISNRLKDEQIGSTDHGSSERGDPRAPSLPSASSDGKELSL
jgi:hypothetical protein